jgi:hypothetical protein
VFPQLSWITIYVANQAQIHLKQLRCRMYSFLKQPEFSLGHYLFDAPAANTDGFLLRDSCVSSTHLSRPFEVREP